MDRQTATQLIGNTFNYPFDEGRFRNFAINFLNDMDERKGFDYLSGTYIRHSFKNHITKYRRLGTYTDPNDEKIDVLVVQLKNEWALERSRTMLRNFTSDYLKNRDEKDAALVAYYTTNPDDWRFSFIRMEYKRVKEGDKYKIKQDITPAKRYSFLVGKNEPNHTAQAQLVGILADVRKNPTLSELETAFSVDAVTKQFYKDYRTQFEKLWNELKDIVAKDSKIAEEFETKTIDTANFTKKLMGQIVFLYFLQKKGWLGVGKDEKGNFKEWGTGPKNFLRRLFDKEFTDYVNFFNEVLEPLFYEALATERPNDVFSRFNCKIPFLNGGLFEPINDYNWEETDIRIDNDLIADVLKTFDQYNFTVREDEPLEKEVAVDPEMLGKVFENLLPENLRKGKGAYYTPRAIVHYMCQESLINYLDTEVNKSQVSYQVIGKGQLDSLGNEHTIGQFDIQSGHRDVPLVPKEDIETLIRESDIILELETAIVEEGKKYKSVLMNSIKENAKTLDNALAKIKVCDPAIGSGAFPVGMLTEIVKARKVLELYLGKKHGVYELKRHCIQNSLYGVDIDSGAIVIAKLRLWLSLVVDEEDYTNIQSLPNLDYKIMQGNSLIEEFHGISLDIKKREEQIDAFTGGSDLDSLIDDLHQKQDDFFNAEHPREKKKKRYAVETAIYNIFHNELEKKKSISPQEAKSVETDLKEMTHGNKERNFFPWKLYFADVFREKGGFNVMIGNPPYISNKKMHKLGMQKTIELFNKTFLSTKSGNFDVYILFIENGFKLLKGEGNLSFIIPNKFLIAKYSQTLLQYLLKNKFLYSIDDFSQIELFDASVYPIVLQITKRVNSMFYRRDFKLSNYQLICSFVQSYKYEELDINNLDSVRKDQPLIDKIIKQSIKLGDELEVLPGINGFQFTNYGKCIYDDIENGKRDENTKKLVITGSIDKYIINYGNIRYNKRKIEKPIIKYDPNIISEGKWKLFSSKKIVIAGMAKQIEAYFDEQGELACGVNVYSVFESNTLKYKYILAYLNTKLATWLFRTLFYDKHLSGDYISVNATLLRKLPIIQIPLKIQSVIIKIVDRILTAKKANPQADTTDIEAEIDKLVYELYGLTEEEIAIVEESVK